MATDRKRFAAIETTLLREDWPDDLKLTLVLLTLHMSDRWAAEKLTAEQGATCRLSMGDALNATSTTSLEAARDRLHRLAEIVSMRITERGTWTIVHWPKLAVTQGWHEIDKRRDSASARNPSGQDARRLPVDCPSIAPALPVDCPSFAPPQPQPQPLPEPQPEPEEDPDSVRRRALSAADEKPAASIEPPAPEPTSGDTPQADAEPWRWLQRIVVASSARASPAPKADEAEAWLAELWPEIEASADAEACAANAGEPSQREVYARCKRIALARWRVYLRGERRHRNAAHRRGLHAWLAARLTPDELEAHERAHAKRTHEAEEQNRAIAHAH